MKKNLKSVFSLILALCMVACLAVPAFAENDNVIIINQNSNTVSNSQQSGVQTPPPAPKKKSNYDYAVLTGNEGTYKQDLQAALKDIYMDPSNYWENPDKGDVDISLFSLEYAPDGLSGTVVIKNGLNRAITVKRLDHLLIMNKDKVVAKVPNQFVKVEKISANNTGLVDFTIKPEYFDHHAKLSGLSASYSIEADIIYD